MSNEREDASVAWKVGDKLAFHRGYGVGMWEICEITSITPSGRIRVDNGRYELEADLKIRGRRGYGGPYRGEPVTAEVLRDIRRKEMLSVVCNSDWNSLGDDVLERVIAAMGAGK